MLVSSNYAPNNPILGYRRSLDQWLLVSLPKDAGKVGDEVARNSRNNTLAEALLTMITCRL